jgi:pimeloyl-ACP methyl ester carboxylesterase
LSLDQLASSLGAESDRACGVLGAALLDAKLELLFRRRLGPNGERLLGKSAPLGSFSSRIRLAYALGWISDDAHADLDTVRDIRNDFAHDFDLDLGFESSSIADRCRNLRCSQAFLDGHDDWASRPKNNVSTEVIHGMRDVLKPPRWRFRLAIEFLAQYLDDLSVEQATYHGPDLVAEVRALSANTRIVIRATATVGDPFPSKTDVEREPRDAPHVRGLPGELTQPPEQTQASFIKRTNPDPEGDQPDSTEPSAAKAGPTSSSS